MGNFNKYLCLLGLVFLMSACKTEKNEVFPRIINEAITSVRDKEISMTYQISSLGYTKSGVRYYKKDNPSQGKSVEAVREGDMFRLTLNELDSESTYILVPYIEYNGNTIESERKTEPQLLHSQKILRSFGQIQRQSMMKGASLGLWLKGRILIILI